MEIIIKILTWALGIVVLILGWTIVLTIGELKVLIFDKTLTKDERKGIKKQLNLLFVVPVIVLIIFLLFSFQTFTQIVLYYILVLFVAFIILDKKKKRSPVIEEDIIEAKKDFIVDGKGVGDDIAEGFHNHFT